MPVHESNERELIDVEVPIRVDTGVTDQQPDYTYQRQIKSHTLRRENALVEGAAAPRPLSTNTILYKRTDRASVYTWVGTCQAVAGIGRHLPAQPMWASRKCLPCITGSTHHAGISGAWSRALTQPCFRINAFLPAWKSSRIEQDSENTHPFMLILFSLSIS